MSHQIKIIAQHNRNFFNEEIALIVAAVDPRNPDLIGYAKPLEIDWVQRGQVIPSQATIGGMRLEDATYLMDSLWEAGVRPSRQPTTMGVDMKTIEGLHLREIEHLRRHVQDLRDISRHALGMGVEGPVPVREALRQHITGGE